MKLNLEVILLIYDVSAYGKESERINNRVFKEEETLINTIEKIYPEHKIFNNKRLNQILLRKDDDIIIVSLKIRTLE